MKKIVTILSLCVALILLAGACTKTPYDLFGNISGTVIDDATGEPIQQVTVTLKPTIKNTYTGMDGMFEFHEIEAGNYEVWTQKSGYGANNVKVYVGAGETVTVSLRMKKN